MWVAGLATLIIVAAVAVSASGLMASMIPSSHGSTAPAHGVSVWNPSTGPYSVNFTESGLPSGTVWVVHLHEEWSSWQSNAAPAGRGWFGWHPSDVNASNTSAIGFSVGNGTYDFSVSAWGSAGVEYAATPSYGNLTVNGTDVSVAISFVPIQLYTVTFSESGLPSGTFWAVFLHGDQWGSNGPGASYGWYYPNHGGFGWNGSSSDSVTFSLPNGTYNFGVPPAGSNGSLYLASPSSGNFTVSGGAVSVGVSFSVLQLYNVTFVESGLPSGTFWAVQLLGGWGESGWNGSTTDSINFTVPNGTFYFGVGPAWNSGTGYVASPAFGNVTVDGATVTIDVTFTEASTHSWGQSYWE